MQEPIKEVDVNGARYQLNHMEARAGGRVLARFVKQLRKMAAQASNEDHALSEEAKEPEPEKLIQLLLLNMDEDDFEFVQAAALGVVRQCSTAGNGDAVYLPLSKGGSLVPSLAEDIDAVLTLTSQSLFANLAPFFTKKGLQKLLEAAPMAGLSR